MVFDAVAVSGDYMLASVTVYDPAQPERLYLTMDLNTAAVDGNTPLVRRLSWVTRVCAVPCSCSCARAQAFGCRVNNC